MASVVGTAQDPQGLGSQLAALEDSTGFRGPAIACLFHICFEVEDIDGALAELKQKGVKLRDETPRIGHGGARIAFIDPSSTGNVLIELAELPAGHGTPA